MCSAAMVGLPSFNTSLTLDHVHLDPTSSTPQLTALRMLRVLEISDLEALPSNFSRLTCLRALEEQHLLECEQLPTCLDKLPALRTLRVHRALPEDAWAIEDPEPDTERYDIVEAALRPLASQLTHLALSEYMSFEPFPEYLSEFACLQSLCWDDALLPCVGPLPLGPWLRSLRQVALPAVVAAASLGVLAAATRLEALALFDCLGVGGVAAALEVAAWAAQQQGLRTLELWSVGLQTRSFPAHVPKEIWRELTDLDAGLARLQLPPTLKVMRGNELCQALSLFSDADCADRQ